jgi:hypothetical protein
MSRRVRNNEIGFGSDSFLDIIANIVGILIILIVVAGLRVSQAPVTLADEADVPAPVPAAPVRPPARMTAPEPVAATEPSPELVDAIRALEQETDAILSQSAADEAQAKQLTAKQEELARRLAEDRRLHDAQLAALEAEKRGLIALRQSADGLREHVRRAELDLKTAEQTKAPVEKLEHKVTPVSRVVKKKEVHFRVSGGRVVPVPLDDLMSRLKSQVERQKNWLAKFRQHQGKVGPVNGFTMTYIVARQQLSVVDQLRGGGNMMRIGVTEWKLEVDANLRGETPSEALTRQSRFIRVLQELEPETTLTFWVYPDSFAEFHKLQSFAHANGFTVAGRPLPFGIAIAGSPNGTRSAGQ